MDHHNSPTTAIGIMRARVCVCVCACAHNTHTHTHMFRVLDHRDSPQAPQPRHSGVGSPRLTPASRATGVHKAASISRYCYAGCEDVANVHDINADKRVERATPATAATLAPVPIAAKRPFAWTCRHVKPGNGCNGCCGCAVGSGAPGIGRAGGPARVGTRELARIVRAGVAAPVL